MPTNQENNNDLMSINEGKKGMKIRVLRPTL